MKDRARRTGRRTVSSAMRSLPGPVVRRLVQAWAPLARYGGASRGGAAALAKAFTLLSEPPLALRGGDDATSLPELAARVGRSEDEVESWARWGLLGAPVEPVAPEGPSLWGAPAVDRARLIDYLLAHGVSEEALRDAEANHRLPLLAIDQAVSDRPSLTREEVARRAGVDADFAARVWRALGLPPGEPGEALFSRRDVEGMRILAAMRAIFTDDDLVEGSSVLGLAMSQVAASQVELFSRRVSGSLRDRSGNLDFVLRRVAMVDIMLPTAGLLLELAYRRHIEAAVRGESLAMVEEAEGGLPGQVELCVGFADLVGFTSASEQLVPLELGEMAAGLVRHAEATLPSRGARIVKTIGDAVMFTAPEAAAGAAAAVDLVEAVGQDSGLPPLRAGLAQGPVLRRYGDVFGRTVNVASRLCAAASPGEVLLHTDGELDEAAWASRGVAAGRRSKHRLKGFDGSVEAVPVLRR